MKKEYHVYTNKLWKKNMVGYRAWKVEDAIAQGADLVCHSKDRPNEIMTIPNFLIERETLIKAGRLVRDRTGASVKLYDFWWKPDGVEQPKVEAENEKQLKLIN
jgi:hypothetical protein